MQKTDLIPHHEIDERKRHGRVGITAVTRLKHADLLAAAKKFEHEARVPTKNGRKRSHRYGGQAALARKLKVVPSELGRWINLQACPPAEPNTPRGKWSAKRIARLEKTLFEITGKTLEELFPKELRDNVKFLSTPKVFERTAYVEAEALTQYAIATRERMLLEQQVDDKVADEDAREKIEAALRESLNSLKERERLVLEMRFGLNGFEPQTNEEVAHHFAITRSRVHQIEAKAIRKLGGHVCYPRYPADKEAALAEYRNVMCAAANLHNVVVDAVFE